MKHLIDTILTCTTAPEKWGGALDQFNAEFQVSASCMFSVHEFRDLRVNFEWSDHYRRNLPTEILEKMQRGDDAGDAPGYRMLFQSPPQRFYNEMQMFHVDTYDALPPSDIRSFTQEQGFVMRMASALNQSGPWIDGFFCHHRETAQWQRLMADQRAELVLPIMANSVALGRTLRALNARYQASLSMLDALGLGVFLVDETGCVVDKNKEAGRLLDLADGVRLSAAKRLVLNSADRTGELDTMIGAANGLLRGEISGGDTLLTAPRPSGKYDFLISVKALDDSTAELEAGLKCAFVTVIDPTRPNVLSVEGVAALGQLSEAEAAIVALLVQGFRPGEVADRRDVSLNTVKTQLKTISQKLRCSTQSDIIRAAAATRLPIEPPNSHD